MSDELLITCAKCGTKRLHSAHTLCDCELPASERVYRNWMIEQDTTAKLLARNDRLEAQLAECHRLSLLGGAKFGEAKVEAETLIADKKRAELMVRDVIRLWEASDSYPTSEEWIKAMDWLIDEYRSRNE